MRLAPEFQSSLFKKEKKKVENIPQKAPESSESQDFKALTSLSKRQMAHRLDYSLPPVSPATQAACAGAWRQCQSHPHQAHPVESTSEGSPGPEELGDSTGSGQLTLDLHLVT